MVKVVIDREMQDAFRKKASRIDRFREGGRIRLVESTYTGQAAWYWEEISSLGSVFKSGSADFYQYDNEFTEWLKVHRPEVFL